MEASEQEKNIITAVKLADQSDLFRLLSYFHEHHFPDYNEVKFLNI